MSVYDDMPFSTVGQHASLVHGDPHGVWEGITLGAIASCQDEIEEEYGPIKEVIVGGPEGNGIVKIVFESGFPLTARMTDHHADARLILID